MKGLIKKINSNRDLAKRFKKLNRISFCDFNEKFIFQTSSLKRVPFDLHKFYPTDDSYIFRAIINKNQTPYTSINWIRFNPEPDYISRANLRKQGVAYYSCAPDISIIESCIDKLRTTSQREFDLTVSRWKIIKNISFQIICNSLEAQSAGTDLDSYCIATNKYRRNSLSKKDYRTYFLKVRFLADQYAKSRINCEKDYYISAVHATNVLNPKNNIDGIVYPSVQYFHKGFNYAFAPRLFENSYFKIEEVAHIKAIFDKNDIHKYPKWDVIKSTSKFDNDKIIW